MVKMPATNVNRDYARQSCIERFRAWWNAEHLRGAIGYINPDVLKLLSDYSENLSNPDKLAEILYDCVGPRFLRDVNNDRGKRNGFLYMMIKAAINKGYVRKSEIQGIFNTNKKTINDLTEINNIRMSPRLAHKLAIMLELPPQVAEKPYANKSPKTEVIIPHSALNPLYDYQYATGLYVRNILEGAQVENGYEVKRKLIAIPTGSGKTRMMVETIIGWLNDGKPSKNRQQRDSKFILWIAQSREICEQSFSTFKTVFEATGRRGTTLHLHRLWGGSGAPNITMKDMINGRGIIIATIQSLHTLTKGESYLKELADMTSCIIIDEAHHAVASSYAQVLRKMGFNWDNRKKEISEKGIILFGLTATPFRGTGTGEDTVRLERWFNGIYFPNISIPNKGIENFKPHALIDCQTFARTGEYVQILGERSYDRDGYIDDGDYFWRITRLNLNEKGDPADKWTFERSKNINFKFAKPGEYEISLKVRDNEGDYNIAKARIYVEEQSTDEQAAPTKQQKQLYRKLIRKNILCEVYHKILPSERFNVSDRDIKHMETFGEFGQETLKQVGKNIRRNKKIVSEIVNFKLSGRKHILFFGCSVDHSRLIALLLKAKHNIKAKSVDSKMDTDSRIKVIEDFRSGNIEVMCNFDVLTTGFDAPNVDCVFVGRPVTSTLLYTQMIGRGMRGIKTGGTKDVVLVDMDDNFQLGRNNMQDQTVNMGWKIFREYWKSYNDAQDVPRKSKESASITGGSDSKKLTYRCTKCNVMVEGIEVIKNVFGIDGPDKILVKYIEEGRHDQMPTSECQMCRIGVKPNMEYAAYTEIQDKVKISAQFVTENLNNDLITPTKMTTESIDSEFAHIKDEIYLHVPTSRQFWNIVSPETQIEIKRLYGGYDEYLKARGLSIREQLVLEDSLYDEYFDLYTRVNSKREIKQKINRRGLHLYGSYTIDDYIECFGTFREFEETVDDLVARMHNRDKKVSATDLYVDYDGIVKNIGRTPHFKEVKTMSYLGIEYYLALFGSLGRFKQIRIMADNAA